MRLLPSQPPPSQRRKGKQFPPNRQLPQRVPPKNQTDPLPEFDNSAFFPDRGTLVCFGRSVALPRGAAGLPEKDSRKTRKCGKQTTYAALRAYVWETGHLRGIFAVCAGKRVLRLRLRTACRSSQRAPVRPGPGVKSKSPARDEQGLPSFKVRRREKLRQEESWVGTVRR